SASDFLDLPNLRHSNANKARGRVVISCSPFSPGNEFRFADKTAARFASESTCPCPHHLPHNFAVARSPRFSPEPPWRFAENHPGAAVSWDDRAAGPGKLRRRGLAISGRESSPPASSVRLPQPAACHPLETSAPPFWPNAHRDDRDQA